MQATSIDYSNMEPYDLVRPRTGSDLRVAQRCNRLSHAIHQSISTEVINHRITRCPNSAFLICAITILAGVIQLLSNSNTNTWGFPAILFGMTGIYVYHILPFDGRD